MRADGHSHHEPKVVGKLPASVVLLTWSGGAGSLRHNVVVDAQAKVRTCRLPVCQASASSVALSDLTCAERLSPFLRPARGDSACGVCHRTSGVNPFQVFVLPEFQFDLGQEFPSPPALCAKKPYRNFRVAQDFLNRPGKM